MGKGKFEKFTLTTIADALGGSDVETARRRFALSIVSCNDLQHKKRKARRSSPQKREVE
jgi:hypothetical protein